MNESERSLAALGAVRPDVVRVQQGALWVGIVSSAACLVGAFFSREHFFHAYLLGYLLWLGVALGCLPLMMLHHQTGGAWGLAIRRLLEAGTRTLPLMALFFLPLLLGLHDLYVWSRPEAVRVDEVLQHKSPYLNVPFFTARAIFYFAVWMTLAYLLNKWSMEQDETGNFRLARRMQVFSGPGIAFYALTATFASFDWVMSLEPRWYSTIFGMLFVAGQGVTAFAFTIAVLVLLSGKKPLSAFVTADVYQDLGKLLLAFIMVWTYFSFSQLLIIWAGNLTEEIPWYLDRWQGGWWVVALAILFLHFLLPFLLLLSRDIKRSAKPLAAVAILVFVMRFVDLFWQVEATFSHKSFAIHWLDVAVPVALGGLWIAFFLRQLVSRALLPVRDPYMIEAFADAARH